MRGRSKILIVYTVTVFCNASDLKGHFTQLNLDRYFDGNSLCMVLTWAGCC